MGAVMFVVAFMGLPIAVMGMFMVAAGK